jgi:hypothetical protein
MLSFTRRTLLHGDIVTGRGLYICVNEPISSLEVRGLNSDTEYTELLSNFYRIEQSNIIPLYSEVSEFEFLPRN